MILLGIRIIVGDDGFEPEAYAPEVWCTSNEPPHLPHLSYLTSKKILLFYLIRILIIKSHLQYSLEE